MTSLYIAGRIYHQYNKFD